MPPGAGPVPDDGAAWGVGVRGQAANVPRESRGGWRREAWVIRETGARPGPGETSDSIAQLGPSARSARGKRRARIKQAGLVKRPAQPKKRRVGDARAAARSTLLQPAI